MVKIILTILFFTLFLNITLAQKNQSENITQASLGTFPYLKKLPNFYTRNSSDSIISETNEVYLYDGKKVFKIIGKTYTHTFSFNYDKAKNPSEFQLINEYDKIITALGGQKMANKTNIDEILKKDFKQDVVDLSSKNQIVGNAYQGFISYEIKTKNKEVYVQLQPYSIGSYFYTLLVVEKQTEMVNLNTNNENQILKDLTVNKTAIIKIDFELDSDILLSQSKDEILLLLGVLQAHKDWKLVIEVHQAPLGKLEDNQALSQKRANAIKVALNELGVNSNQIIASGIGDKKPLTSNDTEKGRVTNTRVEIRKM